MVNVADLIKLNDWQELPDKIITREGTELNISGDVWHLPYVIRDHASIDFLNISNESLRWGTKKYIKNKLETTSTHAGYTSYTYLKTEIFNKQEAISLQPDKLKSSLVTLFERIISEARENHRLWALYRPIQWYIWCAENYPEIGFCPAYAMELEGMSIPGNPKGEAVRQEDPDKGPLHRSLELPLLINALRNDQSYELKHLQEKAAVALSIALGRNPANLTYLIDEDLFDLTPEGNERCYVIRMPRIKKRQINPRDDYLEEYLETEFAKYLIELIDRNKELDTSVIVTGKTIDLPKPLFIKIEKNKAAVASGVWESTYNMVSNDISSLLKSFVRRHNILSPLTNELLQISARRLRYTLATNLAAEGISKKELARILDHSDTQHVLVYFELAGNIIEHLDKAMAKSFSRYLDFFKGNVINDVSEAINGDRDDKYLHFVNEDDPTDQTDIGVCGKSNICHLDPPFSCYICSKFQPYKHANHEHVLDCFLVDREKRMKKYENSRLGVQLDDVIIAVAQVIELSKVDKVNV